MKILCTFRETTTGWTTTATTTPFTSGTSPEDWLPGCPCNGMDGQEMMTCQMEQAELDPDPCDPGPSGKNDSIIRSKSFSKLVRCPK